MLVAVTMSRDPGYAELHLNAHAWAIIDEYAQRHGQTGNQAVRVAVKLGLAGLCEQMGREDAEADHVS